MGNACAAKPAEATEDENDGKPIVKNTADPNLQARARLQQQQQQQQMNNALARVQKSLDPSQAGEDGKMFPPATTGQGI